MLLITTLICVVVINKKKGAVKPAPYKLECVRRGRLTPHTYRIRNGSTYLLLHNTARSGKSHNVGPKEKNTLRVLKPFWDELVGIRQHAVVRFVLHQTEFKTYFHPNLNCINIAVG